MTEYNNTKKPGLLAVWKQLTEYWASPCMNTRPVTQLAVHLENGQRVYFDTSNAQERARGGPPKTTLTEFFTLWSSDDFAKTLTYQEIPEYYTWDSRNKKWNRRKRGTPLPDVAGVFRLPCIRRMYTINHKQAECYFLRMLLNQIKGPTSFEDLKHVDGVILPTYRDTCLAIWPTEDDNHLHKALEESSQGHSPQSVPKLFVVILIYCEPSCPLALWNDHKMSLAEDIIHSNFQSDCAEGIIYSLCLN